jgi:hypothetical protein
MKALEKDAKKNLHVDRRQNFCILKFLTNARASRKRCQKKRHIEFLRKKFLHKSLVFRQPIKQIKKT